MTDYLQLLKRHDDPRHAEQPPDFDRAAAELRFTKMANEILGAFPGSRFETGAEIQDASFHGQIRVRLGDRFALVRVSNFGRFIALCGDDDDCLTTDARDRLLAIFTTHGYLFIPSDALAIPYDGENAGVAGFKDWGYRYFEWV
jgi:hypothetical protein